MGPMVGVYYSNWSVYYEDPAVSNKTPSSLALDMISHLYYAFFTVDGHTGEVKSADPWCDYEKPRSFVFQGTQYEATGLLEELQICKRALAETRGGSRRGEVFKSVLSVGGRDRGELFSGISQDDIKLDRFVSSAVALVQKYGFDGIDVDWEYPRSWQEGQRLVALLSKLRTGLDHGLAFHATISMASPASQDCLQKLDLPAIDRYLDWWNVMAYDFAGPWSQTVQHHANLYGDAAGAGSMSCDRTLKYYQSHGISPGRLVLGMPNYGRVFTKTRGYGHEFDKDGSGAFHGGTVPLYWVDNIRGERQFDLHRGAGQIYDHQSQVFVTYDDESVLRAKARYCAEQGLKGGFFWDASGDYSHGSSQSHVTMFARLLGNSGAQDTGKN